MNVVSRCVTMNMSTMANILLICARNVGNKWQNLPEFTSFFSLSFSLLLNCFVSVFRIFCRTDETIRWIFVCNWNYFSFDHSSTDSHKFDSTLEQFSNFLLVSDDQTRAHHKRISLQTKHTCVKRMSIFVKTEVLNRIDSVSRCSPLFSPNKCLHVHSLSFPHTIYAYGCHSACIFYALFIFRFHAKRHNTSANTIISSVPFKCGHFTWAHHNNQQLNIVLQRECMKCLPCLFIYSLVSQTKI